MGRDAELKRETWVNGRTSAAAGTVTVATPTTVGGVGLEQFDELLVYLQVTTVLAGTAPTMDIYLQRAVVPNPNPATAAHWDDLYHFTQVTSAANEEVVPLPVTRTSSGGIPPDIAVTRTVQTLAADAGKNGHWGDQIRIVEVMGGTVTTPAVYSIHAMGRLN